MQTAVLPVWEGSILPPPKHAKCLDPWEMRDLQQFVEDPSTSAIMANIGGAYLASAVGIVRTKQMQGMSLENEANDGAEIALDSARYAKDPKCRGKSEHIIIVKRGIKKSPQWFKVWRSTLRSVRKGNFSYRDFEGSDPRIAKVHENCAMPMVKIRKSLRIVLQVACGMSPAKAAKYSYHGARHFLPRCSRARGEPVGHQLELGAWCGSDVALAGMLPTEARARVQEMSQRNTPDRYAAEEAVQRAAGIMAANCDAVANLVERVPTRPHDIRDDGFDMLDKYSATC